MATASEVFTFCGGEIRVWAEADEPIMLRAVDSHGDPVELTVKDAREIAARLLQLADWCDT